jgi:hypothetical protein
MFSDSADHYFAPLGVPGLWRLLDLASVCSILSTILAFELPLTFIPA